ncbi:hypothetical protein ACPCTO_09745 [Streptomyces olivoreticuli]
MRLLPHATELTAPARRRPHATGHHHADPAEHVCLHVSLILGDGPERDYRLDDSSTCPRPYAAHAAYDPRVHIAYILARQGHDAHWLARFTGLPLPAAYRIAGAAALSRA